MSDHRDPAYTRESETVNTVVTENWTIGELEDLIADMGIVLYVYQHHNTWHVEVPTHNGAYCAKKTLAEAISGALTKAKVLT